MLVWEGCFMGLPKGWADITEPACRLLTRCLLLSCAMLFCALLILLCAGPYTYGTAVLYHWAAELQRGASIVLGAGLFGALLL